MRAPTIPFKREEGATASIGILAQETRGSKAGGRKFLTA
jgi:hypothetical protein